MEEREVTTRNSTVEEWTQALAESTGSPGGGAGTGVMLAAAASLASMVAGYTEPGADQQQAVDELRDRARTLRSEALQLADEDSTASRAFGAAFRLQPGEERDNAIREASVDAARASAVLGARAVQAIDDLAWLAEHGNKALIADVVVAFGALRAAVAGARTNVSFDLGTLRSTGASLEEIRVQQPELWASVERLTAALERIDALTEQIDSRAAPTDSI
jgi:formiminotetrahydrofolate cyclodeaminase